MELGDTVTVRATGQRARIVAELSEGLYQVEYMLDQMTDPLDRDTVQSEDQGGVYRARDLAPLE
jgi:hypothetical protein